MQSTTSLTAYDPRADIAEHYPAWHIGIADLGGRASEMICVEDKIILIDPAGWNGDVEMALAHVASHLDHHMHALGDLNQCHEEQADYYAEVRLDRPGWQEKILPDCGGPVEMASGQQFSE